MNEIYIYSLHSWETDFYLSDREKSEQEVYCPTCEESDTLLGVYDDEAEFAETLKKMFLAGYELLPCDNYDAIIEKYCPPEARPQDRAPADRREAEDNARP